jgi:tetratricopeptide (TPR) repeat protein
LHQHLGTAAPKHLSTTILVLACLLAYANSFSGPFIIDDVKSIVENREIRAWWNLKGLIYGEPELAVSGRPLVNASFAINYALGGLDVRGYHVWNVATHLGCALLLFGIVRRTLLLRGAAAHLGVGPDRAPYVAFAVALLWMVHPLNTDAVDYLTQRTETMMAFFYLSTLYASIRAIDSSTWTGWPVVATLTCALGMACKETMVTAPVMVALYDRAFAFDSIRQALRARWRLYAGLAAGWLVLAYLLSSSPRVSSAGFSVGVTPFTYLLNQSGMIVRYVQLSVWPRALVVDYGWPVPLTLSDVLPQAALVTALGTAALAAFLWQPPLGFLAVWFFVTLAPSSSLVPIATEVGAERRMYLPLMALVALAVVAVIRSWNRVMDGKSRTAAVAAAVALAVVSVALTAGTISRNREYQSSLRLAETNLERWPTPFAHHGLGIELLAAGRRDEAIVHLRQAVTGAPRAHFTLGVEMFRQDRWDEAARELAAYIQAEPTTLDAVAARELLGRAFAKLGRPAEALEEYRAALLTNPSATERAELHRLLADALFGVRSYGEAVTHYEAYLQFHPAEVAALTNLAIALGSIGRLDDAVIAFKRAVEVEPQNGAARRNLANALFDHRDLAEAANQAREAVALRPDDPAAHDVYGRVLAVQGHLSEAIAEFERALQIDPTNAELRDHLARIIQMRARQPPR